MKTRSPAKNRRKWAYGLTDEDVAKQLAAQNNRCAICGLVFEAAGRRGPHVDHDHDLYRLRKLLCFKCNLMLGCAEDDPELLKRAAQYLERFYLAYAESVGYDPQKMDFLYKAKQGRSSWLQKVLLRVREHERLAAIKPNGAEKSGE